MRFSSGWEGCVLSRSRGGRVGYRFIGVRFVGWDVFFREGSRRCFEGDFSVLIFLVWFRYIFRLESCYKYFLVYLGVVSGSGWRSRGEERGSFRFVWFVKCIKG